MPIEEEDFTMSLEFTLEKLDGLDEATQRLYQKDGERFVLQVKGAVAESEVTSLREQLEAEKKASIGPEGKSYREMFEGSQTANAAIRRERDAMKSELDGWKAFGTVQEVQSMRDELEGLKAKGQKLDEAQTQIVTLKQSARELEGKITALEAEKKTLTEQNATLSAFKKDADKKADLYDADKRITACVSEIKEANKEALKLQLLDRYRLGDLVRNDRGELVSRDDGKSLAEFAVEKMKAYNLYERSTTGYPLNQGTRQTSTTDGDTIDKLFANLPPM